MEATDFTKGIIAAGGLIISTTDTPTRVGDRIRSLDEMELIPNPAEGQTVWVRSERRHYVITGLKPKDMGGLEVQNASVGSYEPLVKVDAEQIQLVVDEAINRFATQLSDDNTVNTFKELVDYAAEHQSSIASLIVKVDTEVQRNDRQDERIEALEALVLVSDGEGQKTILDVVEEQTVAVAQMEQTVQAQAAEIQNLQQLIGEKPVAAQIEEAFAWAEVE